MRKLSLATFARPKTDYHSDVTQWQFCPRFWRLGRSCKSTLARDVFVISIGPLHRVTVDHVPY